MAARLRWRLGVVVLLSMALIGCGFIEPTEGDMASGIAKRADAMYGPGAQIEYIEKTVCSRSFRPAGYLCRFRLATNTKLPVVNQGLFYYDHGWQVKNLTLNPDYPS